MSRRQIRTADEVFRLTNISINLDAGSVCIYYVRTGDNHTKQRRCDSNASACDSVDKAWELVALVERGVVEDVPEPKPPLVIVGDEVHEFATE